MRADAARNICRIVLIAAAVVVGLTSCGGPAGPEVPSGQGRSETLASLENVAAMSVLPEGLIVAGDRLTGVVYQVDPALDELDDRSRPVARVDVSTDGQQGLLGLVADDRRVYAAWTTADEARLVVGRFDRSELRPIDGGVGQIGENAALPLPEPKIIWNGFPAATGANGGHLDLLPDGRIVIGVGTLRNSRLVDDPSTVNGKLLALHPQGPPDQEPHVLSWGWKNPFAFVVSPPSGDTGAVDGAPIWVADNEPEDGSAERLGRGDEPEASLIDLETSIAPASLVRLPGGDLGVCGYLTGIMQRIDINDDRPSQPGDRVVGDCNQAAVVLNDGRLVTSNGSALVIHSDWSEP